MAVAGLKYMKRLKEAFGGPAAAPQHTEITAAMQLGTEATDEQVRELLRLPDFPSFEQRVQARKFNEAWALASADTEHRRSPWQ
eukprot:SAG11_NODE_6638_length_1275_cov_1.688776_2_plen_84_part_00